MCYRAVAEGLVTWTEVTTCISIDDVDRLLMTADLLATPPPVSKTPRSREGARALLGEAGES
jgi:hypothetical protein